MFQAHGICADVDSSRGVFYPLLGGRAIPANTLPGHGPALFRPVEDGDPLKDVIDNVSVPLSLPIAGRKTTMQGTLGPYFRVGNKLYAITVRHNVFLLNGDNESYNYHSTFLLDTLENPGAFLTLTPR